MLDHEEYVNSIGWKIQDLSFAGKEIFKPVLLHGAEINGTADFRDAKLNSDKAQVYCVGTKSTYVNFSGSKVLSNLQFNCANVDHALFNDAEFKGYVDLNRVRIDDVYLYI
jgi:uncharacterized protein YjbI with pentapeptide repeats